MFSRRLAFGSILLSMWVLPLIGRAEPSPSDLLNVIAERLTQDERNLKSYSASFRHRVVNPRSESRGPRRAYRNGWRVPAYEDGTTEGTFRADGSTSVVSFMDADLLRKAKLHKVEPIREASSDPYNVASYQNDLQAILAARREKRVFQGYEHSDVRYLSLVGSSNVLKFDPFRWFHFARLPLGSFLAGDTRSFAQIVHVEPIVREKARGESCYKVSLQCRIGAETSPIRAVWWLNPKKDYAPEKIVVYESAGYSVVELDLAESNGVWYPARVRSRDFEGAGANVRQYREEVFEFTEFKANLRSIVGAGVPGLQWLIMALRSVF